MITAAVQGPLTEAEVREAIESALNRPGTRDIGDVIYEFTTPIHTYDDGQTAREDEALWHDLRPSERARLSKLGETIYELESEIEKLIADRVVAIALQFAAEFPDAPRAER